MRLKRFAALLLCAALTLCLFAGCGSGSSSSSSEAAAGSSSAPDSTAEASASGVLPPAGEDNSLTLTDPAEAFESSLGWGQGTAGTSLKAIIAAADMLEWAEDNNVSHQNSDKVEETLEEWYGSLTEEQQENLAEAWPLINEDAGTLLDDKNSISGAIEDAGLDIDKLPNCTKANWETLQKALDEMIPEAEQ